MKEERVFAFFAGLAVQKEINYESTLLLQPPSSAAGTPPRAGLCKIILTDYLK